MDRTEALTIIRSAVADCLALDLDDVRLESRLVADLGADSLDFVDLIFTIERKFGVKIRESELDFLGQLDAASSQATDGEFLPLEVVEKLRPWLPALDRVEDPEKVKPSQVFGMISVETLWLLVERKLQD